MPVLDYFSDPKCLFVANLLIRNAFQPPILHVFRA